MWIETHLSRQPRKRPQVTPFVGVWIETVEALAHCILIMSHPSWVCGLKLICLLFLIVRSRSHPSWVCGLKRLSPNNRENSHYVTPFVGVWIETNFTPSLKKKTQSHPSWVCGLKRYRWQVYPFVGLSHPSWVCGLKLALLWSISEGRVSHPSWVCGLKLSAPNNTPTTSRSHPSWVCGLKLSMS